MGLEECVNFERLPQQILLHHGTRRLATLHRAWGAFITNSAKAPMIASAWLGAPRLQWQSKRLPESSSSSAINASKWLSNLAMHSCTSP